MLYVVDLILFCTHITVYFLPPWEKYEMKAHWTHQALATYSSYVVAQTFQICILNFSQFWRCGLFSAPPCSALRFSIVFCVTMASTRVKGKKSHYYLNTIMVLMNSIRFPFYLLLDQIITPATSLLPISSPSHAKPSLPSFQVCLCAHHYHD